MSVLAPLAWLPLVGIALLIARRLGGSWSRALGAARIAAPALLGAWVLIRLFDYLARGGGPMKWVGVARGTTASAAPFADAVLRLGFGAGLVLAAALCAGAKLKERPPSPVPFGAIAAGIAGLAALLVAGTFAAGPLPFATALPLDVAAFIPALAATVALGLAAPAEVAPRAHPIRSAKGTAPAPAVRREPPAPHADAQARLEQRGVIAAAPLFTAPGKGDAAAAVAADEVDRIWQACGGAGTAPVALRKAIETPAGAGLLVADLPVPTEDALIDAAALTALMRDARRVLLIAEQPRAVRDRLLGRAASLGGWRAGITTAGDGELAAAIAAGQRPALIVLAPAELAGRALAITAPGGAGGAWTTAIDRVLLAAVDQLPPIASTHAAFGLRRLRLALDRGRTRPSWLATAAAAIEAAAFLEHATLVHFEAISLGATVTAKVRVHVRTGGDAATELPAAAAALRGLPGVAVEDTLHELKDGADTPGWRGAVGLARVEARQLAGLYRAHKRLAHALPGSMHLGVWWVDDSPLARFLLRDGALEGLAGQDELPPARPVVGLANRFLAAAHLEAALAEGAPDEASLRWAFGDPAIDELVANRPEVRTGGRRARWLDDAHRVDASPVLGLGAAAWTDPRRDTVTANAIEVRSSVDASIVARVDRRIAPTRMYPHRVFRARGGLWQVPPTGAQGAAITVGPAGAGATPTTPELEVEVVGASWRGRPEQHSVGKLKFARAIATVDVRERVTGAIARGAAAAGVRYTPVGAEYTTDALVLIFERTPSRKALRHAGRLAAEIVPAHVRVERDDLELLALPDGVGGLQRPSLVIIDRHVGGLGLADALDPQTVHDVLRWTWGVLFRCACVEGCAACTPADVLAAGPDKVGALTLLGG